MPKSKAQSMVIFQPSGRRGYTDNGSTIIKVANDFGVGIESLCGNTGTCGKCKVKIETGSFAKYGIESSLDNLSPPNKAEQRMLTKKQIQDGYRLACQAVVKGDVAVFVPEESRLTQQVVRKKAGEISIELDTAVKLYCVELKPATLEDTTADWERLQAELKKRFNLKNLTIDSQVIRNLQKTVRKGNWKITAWVWMDKEVIRVEPGVTERAYGLAVDIGTTTVAVYLCSLSNGDVVATDSMMNPQVSYGEDVISRINYSMTNKNGLDTMHQAIIRGINKLAGTTAAKAGIKRSSIVDMTVVGNTCMHHIFLDTDPQYLSQSPFPPSLHSSLNIKARELGLKLSPGAYVYVLPVEAGFVGADNVGVLISEEPYNQDEMELIVDIGTNGELLMGNSKKIVSSSCATGPAFEGAEIKYGMRAAPGAIEKVKIDPETKEAQFKVIGKDDWNTELDEAGACGICGSGIIDAAAQLFTSGIIDRTGRFKTDLDTPRLRLADDGPEFVIAWSKESSINQDIVICQKDVRNLQLAKGAMYAGARLMMRHLQIDKLDKVILAGAFGSYIDKESAAVIGLFPDCALDKISSSGNAAGDGARMALLNRGKRAEADQKAREVEYLELTVEPDFEMTFTTAMWFPHMKDSFPHLEKILSKTGK